MVGFRLAVVDDFFVALAFAFRLAVERFFADDFFTAVYFVPVVDFVAVARCRTGLRAAASAIDPSVNAAISATSSIRMVLRMFSMPPPESYSRYASAKPICATNIMRYMCAHDTWFSSTANSSGRRSMR